MNLRTFVVLAVVALLAIAAWPAFMASRDAALAARPSPAPVVADYLHRDAIVAVFERNARSRPDQIITRMLASQYLMRYRETGDVGDLLRAQHAARASLAVQPRNNIGADMALASALQSLHQFNAALTYAREAIVIEPWSNAAIAQTAGIQTELGHYEAANELLRSARPGPRNDAALDTAQARYDEFRGSSAGPQTHRALDGRGRRHGGFTGGDARLVPFQSGRAGVGVR